MVCGAKGPPRKCCIIQGIMVLWYHSGYLQIYKQLAVAGAGVDDWLHFKFVISDHSSRSRSCERLRYKVVIVFTDRSEIWFDQTSVVGTNGDWVSVNTCAVQIDSDRSMASNVVIIVVLEKDLSG